MSKPGFIVMAVIAAAVALASCGSQPRSLFADDMGPQSTTGMEAAS